MIWTAKLTIIVSNPGLKLLVSTQSGFIRIADDIHHSDPIQTYHFLEINKSLCVPVGVLD